MASEAERKAFKAGMELGAYTSLRMLEIAINTGAVDMANGHTIMRHITGYWENCDPRMIDLAISQIATAQMQMPALPVDLPRPGSQNN